MASNTSGINSLNCSAGMQATCSAVSATISFAPTLPGSSQVVAGLPDAPGVATGSAALGDELLASPPPEAPPLPPGAGASVMTKDRSTGVAGFHVALPP